MDQQPRLTRRRLIAFSIAALASATVGAAEPPLKLIVPLGAGGPTDAAARSLAAALADELGRAVNVVNEPGANGATGARSLLAAPADGHTLLFAPLSIAGLPWTMKSAPYTSLTELSLLAAVAGNRMCLYVHPGLGVDTLKEFLNRARSSPVLMGQVSLGEQIVSQQLMQAGGFSAPRLPYGSGPQMLADLVGGKLQAAVLPSSIGVQQVEAGRLLMLACAAEQRIAALPQVPTMNEAGVPTMRAPAGQLIVAPAGLPAEQRERLSAAILRAAVQPAVQAEFRRLHLDGPPAGAAQALVLVRETEDVWRQFVRDAGIAPQ